MDSWTSVAQLFERKEHKSVITRFDAIGQRSETVRRSNLSAIVRELHRGGPASRSELVARTGLTRSAIRGLIGELAAADLVTEERARPHGSPGRPSPVVRLDPTSGVVLALEVAIDTLAAAVVGLGGAVLELARIDRPSGHTSVAAISADLAELAETLRARRPADEPLLGVGVAVVGVVRRSDGFVSMAPNLGWRDVPLGTWLARALDLPVPIADDDVGSATATFNASVLSVNENAGSAVIQVSLNGAASLQPPFVATVDVTTQDGTASSSTDFTATATTLSFDQLKTVQTVTVPITDDAGFTRDEDRSQRAADQVDFLFSRDFGQTQGVGRCATNDGGLILQQHIQACRTAHSSGGDTKIPKSIGPLKSRPEAQEGTEGERKEKSIVLAQPHQCEKLPPILQNPFPALRRVEPPQRCPGRSGCLVQSRISRNVIRQICAVRRL
jgi:DNA-binding transcriptional ArsR family regulator